MGLCNMPLRFDSYAPTDVHGTFRYNSWVLVINEQYGDHEENIRKYGRVLNSYPAASESNDWAAAWNVETTTRKVIIGSDIKPKKMEAWFYGFKEAAEFIGLDRIDTSECTSFNTLFYQCQSVTSLPDIHDWDTSNVTDMRSVFHSANNLADAADILNGWNTSNVEDFSGVICGNRVIKNLEIGFDMSKCKYARSSFSYMTELESIDISGVLVPLLEDAPFMFGVNDKLTTIYSDGSFSLPAGCTAANMFSMDLLIVGGAGTTFSGPGQEYARMDNPPTEPGYFTLKP